MIWRAAILTAALAFAAAPALAKEQRLALIIANQDYPAAVGRLQNTHQDAASVESALTDIGFKVTKVLDADSAGMEDALTNFEKAINDEAADGDDVVAFFYASMHGTSAEVEGRARNFLLPAKEELTTTGQLIRKAVRVDQLVQTLAASKAKAVFIVSDACRNNLATAFSKSTTKGFVAERTGPGVLVAYATEAGATTPDDGVFASILSSELRRPGRKASYAMLEAVEAVSKRRGWEGQPFLQSGGLPDWLCFKGCEAASSAELEARNKALQSANADLAAQLKTIQFSTQGFTRTPPFLRRLDRAFFAAFAPHAKPEVIDAISSRKDVLARYGIDTPQRLAHFLVQLDRETVGFTIFEEKLNYPADQLKRFEPFEGIDVSAYAGDSEKIANRMYANRKGNGDEASGDGWRFRGRGMLQLTGRANYTELGAKLGIDLVGDPDVMAEPEMGLAIAAAYWDTKGFNKPADLNDIESITRQFYGPLYRVSLMVAEQRLAQINELLKPYTEDTAQPAPPAPNGLIPPSQLAPGGRPL